MTIRITLTQGAAVAERRRGAIVDEIGREPLAGDDLAGIERLAAAITATSARDAVLVLGAGWVQIRRLSGFPPVSRRALIGIVALHPFRYFRAPPGGELVTDATWLGDRRQAHPTALCLAADARAVCRVVEALERGGVGVGAVVALGYEANRTSLMPAIVKRRAQRRHVQRVMWLTLALAVLWAGFGGWRIQRLAREGRELAARLHELEPAARSVMGAKRAVDDAALMVRTLDSVASRRTELVAIVDEAVAALPADAFLTQVAVGGADSVRLTGFAGSPAMVVERLRKVRRWERARLLPPAGRSGGSVSGRARFDIIVKLRGRS